MQCSFTQYTFTLFSKFLSTKWDAIASLLIFSRLISLNWRHLGWDQPTWQVYKANAASYVATYSYATLNLISCFNCGWFSVCFWCHGEYLSTGDPETSLCSKAIKIMTYNVCFGQDMELHSRIPAIGDIIQHHSPDLICLQVQNLSKQSIIFFYFFLLNRPHVRLQEVTPEIHGLLEKSDWWPEYKCLMSHDMEYYIEAEKVRSNMQRPFTKIKRNMRSYFCMQV